MRLNFEASQIAQTALQHKNDRLKLLLEVNNTIVSNLELRDLLRAISASLRSVMQCDGVGVALPDAESKHLQVYALDFPNSKGLIREEILIATDEDSAGARVFRTGEPVSCAAAATRVASTRWRKRKACSRCVTSR